MKVPESFANELLKRDYIELFEPRVSKMRGWVFINRKESKDYLEDKDIFERSIEFVSSITKNSTKKKN